MNENLYIVIDKLNNDKHLSYHLTQRSAYITVCNLSGVQSTSKNINNIASNGGFKGFDNWYFVLEKKFTL